MPLDVAVLSYPRNMLEPAVAGTGFKLAVNLKVSTTFKKGQLIGDSIATPGIFAGYASGGTDGEAAPRAVMPCDASTDASGNITVGANADPLGTTTRALAVWFGGIFKTQDLFKDNAGTALDATAAGAIGRVLRGTLTAGLIKVN